MLVDSTGGVEGHNAQGVPGLGQLMRTSRGSSLVRIAIIDGVVESHHEALAAAKIIQHGPPGHPESQEEREARGHATFVSSILVGKPGLGICPDCTLLSVPAFYGCFAEGRLSEGDAARRLAACVKRAIELGADVLHFSLEFAPEASRSFGILASALNQAGARGVRTVVAAGNRGAMSASPVLAAAGVVPVAMAGRDGKLDHRSNRGALVGRRGLLAPGVDIEGAELPTGTGRRWGSSYAAALVTGAFALLRSRFLWLDKHEIWAALMNPIPRLRTRSIVPPRLDVGASLHVLTRHMRCA